MRSAETALELACDLGQLTLHVEKRSDVAHPARLEVALSHFEIDRRQADEEPALTDETAIDEAAFVEKVLQRRRAIDQLADAHERVRAVLGRYQVCMIGRDRRVLRGRHQSL